MSTSRTTFDGPTPSAMLSLVDEDADLRVGAGESMHAATCPTCADEGMVGPDDQPCPEPGCEQGAREWQYQAIERELVKAGNYGAYNREAAIRAYALGARVTR